MDVFTGIWQLAVHPHSNTCYIES